MDDIDNAHRGKRRKRNLLEPEEETPFMPLWQTIIRYTLEVLGILFMATWASTRKKWFGAFCAVIAVLACWRIFSVRDDPATMEQACVYIPGIARISLELCVYAFSCFCLWELLDNISNLPIAIVYVYIAFVLIYYMVSYERVMWVMLKQ